PALAQARIDTSDGVLSARERPVLASDRRPTDNRSGGSTPAVLRGHIPISREPNADQRCTTGRERHATSTRGGHRTRLEAELGRPPEETIGSKRVRLGALGGEGSARYEGPEGRGHGATSACGGTGH